MSLILLPKPSLNNFIQTCTPFAIFPSLEEEMKFQVENIANALLNYESSNNPVENLAAFLKADENFLGIILALTNLSQEKFKRILSAERFLQGDFGNEWDTDVIHRKLRTESGFAERIATLFLEGRNSKLLVEQLAAFYLDQLALPIDWSNIIRDPNLIQNVIRQKLAGAYSNKKGVAVENSIRHQLNLTREKYGVTYAKGQVKLVSKEVDHVIPSIENPYIFIMTSYMETTGSGQTQRANEHRDMYLKIQGDNLRWGTKRILINVIDGVGWLARRTDLKKMYDGCDYIINLKTLDRLEAIICRYVPEEFFKLNPRPQVEG
jgi:hypothetical protein